MQLSINIFISESLVFFIIKPYGYMGDVVCSLYFKEKDNVDYESFERPLLNNL